MARTVCITNIRKAVRKAVHDTTRQFDVNDEWNVYVDYLDRVCLWNWHTDKEVRTGRVVWCSFDGYNELVTHLSNELMEAFNLLPEFDKLPYEKQREIEDHRHPWDALKDAEYLAFQNAYDYLYYGESYTSWVERGHDCGIKQSRRKAIWNMAFWYITDGEAPDDWEELVA